MDSNPKEEFRPPQKNNIGEPGNKRPSIVSDKQVKLVADVQAKRMEDQINDEHLRRIEHMFHEADTDGGGALDMGEFREAMKKIMGDMDDEELDIIFMKIDTNCDGTVDWDEYLNYMLLEYRERDYMQKQSTLIFPKPMKLIPVIQHEIIVKVVFYPAKNLTVEKRNLKGSKSESKTLSLTGRILSVSKDGILLYWSENFKLLRSTRIERSRKQSLHNMWVTDMVCLYNLHLLAVSSTDRDVEFFDVSANKCDRSFSLCGLKNCILAMDYWSDGEKAVFCMGDTGGNIIVFISFDVIENGLFNMCAFALKSGDMTEVMCFSFIMDKGKEFRKCVACGHKLLSQDEYDWCICCLGTSHLNAWCSSFAGFSTRAVNEYQGKLVLKGFLHLGDFEASTSTLLKKPDKGGVLNGKDLNSAYLTDRVDEVLCVDCIESDNEPFNGKETVPASKSDNVTGSASYSDNNLPHETISIGIKMVPLCLMDTTKYLESMFLMLNDTDTFTECHKSDVVKVIQNVHDRIHELLMEGVKSWWIVVCPGDLVLHFGLAVEPLGHFLVSSRLCLAMDSINDLSANFSPGWRDELDKVHSELAILKGEITRLLELMTPPTGSVKNTPIRVGQEMITPSRSTSPHSLTGNASMDDIPNGQRPTASSNSVLAESTGRMGNNGGFFNFSNESANHPDDVYLISGAKPKRLPPTRTYSVLEVQQSGLYKNTQGTVTKTMCNSREGNNDNFKVNFDKFLRLPFEFGSEGKVQDGHNNYAMSNSTLKEKIFTFGNKLTRIKNLQVDNMYLRKCLECNIVPMGLRFFKQPIGVDLNAENISKCNQMFDNFGKQFMEFILGCNDHKLGGMLKEAEDISQSITNDLVFPQWEKLFVKQFEYAENSGKKSFYRKSKKFHRDLKQYEKGNVYRWSKSNMEKHNVNSMYVEGEGFNNFTDGKDFLSPGGGGTTDGRKQVFQDDWCNQIKYFPELNGVACCSLSENKSMVLTIIPHSQKSSIHISVFSVRRGILCFDYSPEWNALVTGGFDRMVRVWNPYVTTSATAHLRGHSAAVTHVMVNGGINKIISISKDKNIRIWDLHEHMCLQSIHSRNVPLGKFPISGVYYNKLSNILVCATSLIGVLYGTVENASFVHQKSSSHEQPLCTALYNRNFKQVVSGCHNGVVAVWDILTGEKVMQFLAVREKGLEITAMCFDGPERRLITGAKDGAVKLWNFNNGACLMEMPKLETTEITGIAYINQRIYISGWSKRVTWYLDASETDEVEHKRWKCYHSEDILSMASYSGKLLATASYSGDVVIWNIDSGQAIMRLNACESPLPLLPIRVFDEKVVKNSTEKEEMDNEMTAKENYAGENLVEKESWAVAKLKPFTENSSSTEKCLAYSIKCRDVASAPPVLRRADGDKRRKGQTKQINLNLQDKLKINKMKCKQRDLNSELEIPALAMEKVKIIKNIRCVYPKICLNLKNGLIDTNSFNPGYVRVICDIDGHIYTELHKKPCHCNHLLYKDSMHPPHVFRSVIRSQSFGPSRLSVKESDFNIQTGLLKDALVSRGYKHHEINENTEQVAKLRDTRPKPYFGEKYEKKTEKEAGRNSRLKVIFLRTRERSPTTAILLTSSADGFVFAWAVHTKGGLLGKFRAAQDNTTVTSVSAMSVDMKEQILLTGDSKGYVKVKERPRSTVHMKGTLKDMIYSLGKKLNMINGIKMDNGYLHECITLKIWDIENYCRQISLHNNASNEASKEIQQKKVLRLADLIPEYCRPPKHEKRILQPNKEIQDGWTATLVPPELLCSWRGHLRAIVQVEYVDRFKLIVTASYDCNIRLWTLSGSYIGTFGESVWQIGEDLSVPKELPSDIKKVGSNQTLKVLNKGAYPHWECARNILSSLTHQKRQHALLMNFMHGKSGMDSDTSSKLKELLQKDSRIAKYTPEQIDATWEKWKIKGQQKSDILGQSYKQKIRHRMSSLLLPGLKPASFKEQHFNVVKVGGANF
ncbi:EF-hand calcium-binding domain-containing protein 8 [Protopterus annectens]|uniref:EF-hand calcium-binding domain-containing protein 8 n=1 Tax=Protopterus annectens TaxID=7888 RepID=UPI001CF9FA0F|nr:EF-hand calcium-binding domain-containing protein 8 [Protopterus annectens]